MGKQEKVTIEHPHLLLCEGLDAKLFFIHYLNHIFGGTQKEFQAEDFGGNEELGKYLAPLYLRSGFEMLKSVTIIRDAEKDAHGAAQSICSDLRKCNFAVPGRPCTVAAPETGEHNVNVAYALFPAFNSLQTSGTLEDLCLSILAHPKEEAVLDIAEGAVSSAEEQSGSFTRRHKNKLHTYLSLTDKYVGLKIGESAAAKAFDFTADNMEPLRLLLESLRCQVACAPAEEG